MKRIIFPIMLLFMISLVLAEPPVYQLDEEVNYRFRCYDSMGDYCNSGTQLIINIEYPDGTNALDNISLTFQSTYFNVTLPTDQQGNGYKALIHSITSNNTITEFTYDVTSSGQKVSLSNTIIIIALLGLAAIFIVISFMFSRDYWIYKAFFQFMAVASGLLSVNSARIVASESNSLGVMGETGITIMIVVLALFFLKIFIDAFIEIIKTFKAKRAIRWEY